MKAIKILSMSLIATSLTLAGCVDNNYDLSDIDTTSRVNVTDLTIPVNIDKIQLKSIIDIDESDPNNHIKIIDGEYAYVQDGDFTTGDITVPKVTISPTKVSSLNLNLPVKVPAFSAGIQLPDIDVTIPAETTDYSFSANNISDNICGLETVRGDLDVIIKISISGVEGLAKQYALDQVGLMLPNGLTFESFDSKDCTYDKDNALLIVNAQMPKPTYQIKGHAAALEIPAGAFDEETHSISMSGTVGLTGGKLTIYPANNPQTEGIDNVSLKIDFEFSQMNVSSIDGYIQYQIDDVDVPAIDITDLPDVLSQPGTNLILTNPCLYLGINNPLYVCNAYAQTGFEITSYHGEESETYSIDNGTFRIAANETDNFCFSPRMPSNVDATFANCEHVPFTSLSHVLSGDGLPDKLEVDLTNPCLPRQHLKDFKLDHNYGNVHGIYKFVAPLQFEYGTQIIYTDKIDGWSSDDLEKMTITRLEVELTISTDVPVAIEFTGYPIDKDGKRINNVSIDGANINANASNQQVKISISGEVSDLDGIEFVAKAAAASGAAALSPDMNITLSNVRPFVSGYYQTEL